MKYYTLDELNKNLGNYIASLGVSQQFLDQPAYEAVIKEIGRVTSGYHLDRKTNDIQVKEGNGYISFECTTDGGKKQIVSISAGSDTIYCTSWKDMEGYNTDKGYVQEKIGSSFVAKIDKNDCVTIENGTVRVDSNPEDYGKCEASTYAKKSEYANNGIMLRSTEKTFLDRPITLPFNEIGSDAAFFIVRQAFDFNTIANNYDSKVILVRDKFDTAKAYAEYKKSGEEYSATVQLNSQHGLRDMELSSSPQDWIFPITPATQDYLDATIGQEKNPKVAAALAKLAVGRDTYYYNPEMDEDYIHENSKNGQGKSR